jgi:hypothetical protein
MYDTETHSEFIGLRARGSCLSKIAEQLDISFTTARNWNHEHWEEIHDLRDSLIDSLRQKFLPDSAQVLNSLTGELQRVNAELDKRDYTNEPTWVLVNRQNMILSRLDKVCANPPLLLVPPPPNPPPNPNPTHSEPPPPDGKLTQN